MPATFLFKTEPGTFSFADLVRDGSCIWDGVANPTALIHLRTVQSGDHVLFYHTGDEKAVVGSARATSDASQDPAKPGLNDRGEPKFAVVKLEPITRWAHPVTLAQIKADPQFKSFALVTQSRLSVMPVPPDLAAALAELGVAEPDTAIKKTVRKR